MNKLIAAIDDSAAARPVLATALALAPVLGATVEAVHVSEDGGGHTAEAMAESRGVPLRALSGDPLETLALVAEEDDVVALAVGARGRPSGRRPAGHLALALAGRIDKPVLVVPPEAHPADRIRRVVVAMEGTPGKARGLKRAVELGTASDVELVVIHVDDETAIPLFSDQVQYEAESYAREFLARYCPGAPDARLELRIGVPADEILATSETIAPDVIAIGWPHTSDADRGLVAREILERSHLPVLLVAIA